MVKENHIMKIHFSYVLFGYTWGVSMMVLVKDNDFYLLKSLKKEGFSWRCGPFSLIVVETVK